MSEHFLGSNKGFEILVNFGQDPLARAMAKVTKRAMVTAVRVIATAMKMVEQRQKEE
jgi:hypothetical protein